MGYNDLIPGKLAMGSAPPEGVFLPFDALVLTAHELIAYQDPRAFLGPRSVLKVDLKDDGSPITRAQVVAAARAGIEVARRVEDGQRVLVTCAMGRNRSGLVSAIAIMHLGWTPHSAISMVRRARGRRALSNEEFVRVIWEYGRGLQTRPDASSESAR